jgi:hypothetical protein
MNVYGFLRYSSWGVGARLCGRDCTTKSALNFFEKRGFERGQCPPSFKPTHTRVKKNLQRLPLFLSRKKNGGGRI